ncbi:MAG: VacJ family lipoprotein [Pseudomonadota bacterium]
MIKLPRQQFLLSVFCLVSLLFTTPSMAAETRTVNPADPYEPFNRVMFNFNDFIDKAILKPVATVYNKIIPKPLAKGINNIFSNIDTIPTVINDVLQINFYQAASDAWRFAVNSTIGIGGFFDVAQHMGLEPNAEDLGLTFAQWGWKDSNYLVLPFLGPSTVRDGIAWPINYEYMTIYPWIYPVSTRYTIYGVGIVSKRAELLRFGDVMDQAALDRYVFMRDAYLQSRNYRIERNKQLGDPYLVKSNLESPPAE